MNDNKVDKLLEKNRRLTKVIITEKQKLRYSQKHLKQIKTILDTTGDIEAIRDCIKNYFDTKGDKRE